jgi:hypothetical protein
LKYVSITLVEAGNAVLAVFDETLQKEALVLTERETDLVRDGFINKEMTTVILRAGVKEVTHISLLHLFDLSTSLPFSFFLTISLFLIFPILSYLLFPTISFIALHF